MNYAEQREARQKSDVHVARHDFSWEEGEVPLLHSGFLERCKGDDAKSAFFVSFFYAHGQYVCRIQDRQSDEKAFVNVGTLAEAWCVLELALKDDTLDWTPDTARRNGR